MESKSMSERAHQARRRARADGADPARANLKRSDDTECGMVVDSAARKPEEFLTKLKGSGSEVEFQRERSSAKASNRRTLRQIRRCNIAIGRRSARDPFRSISIR